MNSKKTLIYITILGIFLFLCDNSFAAERSTRGEKRKQKLDELQKRF